MQVGPFQVVEEIARGGAGVVYRARDAQGRWVALKLLLEHRALNPLARARFRRETAALTRLRHPGVVSIVDAGEFEGQLWIALDFVEGETLEQRLRRGSLPIPEVLDLFQQLVQAMGYVHTCGLLHRDLKPDNVLLSGGRALLTDFGLVLDEGRDGTRVTTSGVFMGTPGYWAPEQAFGDTGAIGPATDVYGLGGVLYACLTGRAPMTGASLEDYVQAVRFGSIVPPRQARTDVPAWLDALCMRCLERDPAARPASVEEVARALASAGSSGAGGRARVGPWAVLVLALGVAASLGVWHLARGEDEPA
ncbi:MAG: serine/threonine protein kinase, partial [Planctomycetes bacterium]|nr:serine/threonine protein kinase [Planctomycetota bacterium]